MLPRVPAGASVVPIEAFLDVCRATDVMTGRIAFAPQNVDESGSDTAHVEAMACCTPCAIGGDSEETASTDSTGTRILLSGIESKYADSEVRLRCLN